MSIRSLFLSCLLLLYFSVNGHAAAFTPDGDSIGAISEYAVKKDDTLHTIARRFDIGIVELLAANPDITNPRRLKAGTILTLPTEHILPPVRKGIVLNLPELRLFYFMPDGTVMTFPVGIGREGWQTPTGSTTVLLKRKDPTWIPPDSLREEDPDLPDFVPPGPNNPLGQYALNIGMEGIRIHGTNQPYSIGKRSSHGCIRLYPEDIETLFNAVEVGTPVTIIDLPYKIGWRRKTLLLEVTPTQDQADNIAAYREPEPADLPELADAVRQAGKNAAIDWQAVDQEVAEHSGIPAAIGKRTSGP